MFINDLLVIKTDMKQMYISDKLLSKMGVEDMFINDLLFSKTDMERMVPERKNISSASEMLPDSDIKEPDLSIKYLGLFIYFSRPLIFYQIYSSNVNNFRKFNILLLINLSLIFFYNIQLFKIFPNTLKVSTFVFQYMYLLCISCQKYSLIIIAINLIKNWFVEPEHR